MKKRLLVGIMLVALLMPIMAQGAAEQKGDQEYLLRFGHVLTPEDTFHKQYLEWAKAVSERLMESSRLKYTPVLSLV